MLNKKIALAAALAAVSVSAMAQGSVQLYGRMNTTMEHQKLGGQTVTGMFNNASRIGFRGVEDLGQGLKAGFVMEGGFSSDTGAGANDTGLSFNRESELFLESNLGKLRLGKFSYESSMQTADMVSMHNHDTGSSADALYSYDTLRTNNQIGYRTPVFANTWVEVAHGFHEKQAGAKNVWDLAVSHQAANYSIGAGFTDNGDNRQYALRATYMLDQLTLGAYVQRVEMNKRTATAEKWNNYRVAAAYALGASELHANVGYADRDDSKSALQWTLGVNHNLSKRTKVYALYTKVDNRAQGTYGYRINSNLDAASAGQDFSSFAVGVRHNF